MDSKVYEIMNALGTMMKDNKTNHEEICLRLVNHDTQRYNLLTISLCDEGGEGV